VVQQAVTKHNMLPCYMTTNGRPGTDAQRQPAFELICTAIQGHRHVQTGLPADNFKALSFILPTHADLIQDVAPLFLQAEQKKKALDAAAEQIARRESSKTNPLQVEKSSVEIAALLVEALVKKRSVCVLMRTTRGTAHKAVDHHAFWALSNRLMDIVEQPPTNKLVLVLLTRDVPQRVPRCVAHAQQHQWFLKCKRLTPQVAHEYMKLRLGAKTLPPDMEKYVYDVSLGTPRYMLETLQQFLARGHISITGGENKVCQLHANLETIALAEWTHTAMVGDVLCEIESLDPQESAIIKMATVFAGTFSIADLAASSKSPWAGAFYLDNLRLYKACFALEARGMLELAQDTKARNMMDETPMFILRNELVRRVAGTMLLEQQKMAVKRAALMQRMLAKELPARLQEKHRRDKELHVPYWILTDLG